MLTENAVLTRNDIHKVLSEMPYSFLGDRPVKVERLYDRIVFLEALLEASEKDNQGLLERLEKKDKRILELKNTLYRSTSETAFL